MVLRKNLNNGKKVNLFKPDTILLDEDVMCDVLMYKLYVEVFEKHAPKTSTNFQGLSKHIKSPACRLAQGTKDSFPTMETLATTIRNVSWNLAYWVCASKCNMQQCPDPIQPMYGYALDARGKPQYLDVVVGESMETDDEPRPKRPSPSIP